MRAASLALLATLTLSACGSDALSSPTSSPNARQSPPATTCAPLPAAVIQKELLQINQIKVQ